MNFFDTSAGHIFCTILIPQMIDVIREQNKLLTENNALMKLMMEHAGVKLPGGKNEETD